MKEQSSASLPENEGEGKEDFKLQCVNLNGEFSDMGNHILMPFGVTLCGMATIDADLKKFPALKDKAFDGLICEYTIQEWDITCDKCLNVFNIIKEAKEKTKK